jgi:hypothetical protein
MAAGTAWQPGGEDWESRGQSSALRPTNPRKTGTSCTSLIGALPPDSVRKGNKSPALAPKVPHKVPHRSRRVHPKFIADMARGMTVEQHLNDNPWEIEAARLRAVSATLSYLAREQRRPETRCDPVWADRATSNPSRGR